MEQKTAFCENPKEHLAPSAVGFGIVFREADPPFAKVQRVALNAFAKETRLCP
jgi:hypothetical protein